MRARLCVKFGAELKQVKKQLKTFKIQEQNFLRKMKSEDF
jgi:hypothetical protein